MPPRTVLVYRVRSWRHHADCLLPTLEAALAHVARDLDCERPGRVTVTRVRLPLADWLAFPEGCDHADQPEVALLPPPGEGLQGVG